MLFCAGHLPSHFLLPAVPLLLPFPDDRRCSMTINNLRDSANGTFVILDDYFSLTEVLEVKVRVVECRDGLARITLEELATTHSVKMAPSRMFVLQDQEWLSVWEKCSFAHRQVDEQPTKRSKKNDVAMLKKENWQERESVTDGCHDRPGKPVKRGDKKLGQNSSKHQFSDARQLDCVFQDMDPPKSIFRKSSSIRSRSNV